MSLSNANRLLAESAKLRAEIERHEKEDAQAAHRAEKSRPDTGVQVPGLPHELVEHERRAIWESCRARACGRSWRSSARG